MTQSLHVPSDLTAEPAQGGFWSTDPSAPRIFRMRDRVFVGDAAEFPADRANTNPTWIPNSTVGANWIVRDSQLAVMQDRGGIAVAGLSRTSDGDATASQPATIGVSGAVIINTANAKSGWGMYSDVQFESGVYGYGIEIAVKNKGANATSTPYFATTGTYGIWLPGGGDASYGGAPTNPNNTAIAIGKNSTTWNAGIVFFADGLTGTDGVTGYGTAIELAKGHLIRWRTPNNAAGGSIVSDCSADNSDTSIRFANNELRFIGFNSSNIARFIHAANGVNYASLTNAAAGSPVLVSAAGTDTNIDISLVTKGSGVVRFGAWTSNADAAINGYVLIRDVVTGTLRKLATIA
jgi:hypothetical protein